MHKNYSFLRGLVEAYKDITKGVDRLQAEKKYTVAQKWQTVAKKALKQKRQSLARRALNTEQNVAMNVS